MQRFKIGDNILILPKFARLYPNESGSIVRVEADPFRPIFNEYTVKFPDGTAAHLFEFQIIEGGPEWKTQFATIVFDSRRESATENMRGPASGRQIVLTTPSIEVDMTIQTSDMRATITGQILEKGTVYFANDVEVRLMKESTPLATASCDKLGVFKFYSVPRGPTNLLVFVPQISLRIFGSFTF